MSEEKRLPLTFLVVGANGKMGQKVREVIKQSLPSAKVIGVDLQGSENYSKIEKVIFEIRRPDVVIDFSSPAAAIECAHWCAQHNVPLVSGTTGLNSVDVVEMKMLSEQIPILWAPNMSLGVNLIDSLLPLLVGPLGEWTIEIVETHHDRKKDCPSGTALRWAKTLAQKLQRKIQTGRPETKEFVHDSEVIAIHSLRHGLVFGEHEIILAKGHERIKIGHYIGDRCVFAEGAFKAARWLIGQEPGYYSMEDVLGFKKTAEQQEDI